jgi:sulfur relay (sulfurtransferase) complex TusBCD TusD component (DsrE family)
MPHRWTTSVRSDAFDDASSHATESQQLNKVHAEMLVDLVIEKGVEIKICAAALFRTGFTSSNTARNFSKSSLIDVPG